MIFCPQNDILTEHLIQIDPVPFLNTFLPSTTTIETLHLLEGAPAFDLNEFLSSYPSSIPSSSQPSASSVSKFYEYLSTACLPIESSASWFGEHNNIGFIVSGNHTEAMMGNINVKWKILCVMVLSSCP